MPFIIQAMVLVFSTLTFFFREHLAKVMILREVINVHDLNKCTNARFHIVNTPLVLYVQNMDPITTRGLQSIMFTPVTPQNQVFAFIYIYIFEE